MGVQVESATLFVVNMACFRQLSKQECLNPRDTNSHRTTCSSSMVAPNDPSESLTHFLDACALGMQENGPLARATT